MKKNEIISFFNSIATTRDLWIRRNSYYHDELERLMTFLIPPDASVLDIGSSTGVLLNKLRPSRGVGIDLSDKMVDVAREKYPHLEFLVQDAEDIRINEKFDYILLSGSIGVFSDVWKVFRGIKKITSMRSRVVITYYNGLWEPVLKLAEKINLRMPRAYQNWLGLKDIDDLLYLNGFEVIKKGKKMLLPLNIPLISWIFNRILANFPFLWRFCLIEYLVAKKVLVTENKDMSCSVIAPCRNEVGNIEPLLASLPKIGARTELIFVDGLSTDGTVEKIRELIPQYSNRFDIRLIHQIPRDDKDKIKENVGKQNKMLKLGKADAVRKGFDAAKGDVLIILDTDCTVPPEDLAKFFFALSESRGEFINGTRLVYPLDKGAMRLFNLYANEFFGFVFSWLLGQSIKDTLCGTKALTKESYLRIKETRSYFGDFDPFGDFELLFGAAKQNLKIVELPVRYRARTYGDIKIERFKHGLLLLQMCLVALRRFKLSN
ncbi:MAG: glycosyltransferase [Candidatus Omnitrophica bacterium]|nr:glycosyltransferase [Candidatus Omnitrophota bacterium]MBU1870169.1 glycosyltransferase [Candidatus Omnitrophota bacterium]